MRPETNADFRYPSNAAVLGLALLEGDRGRRSVFNNYWIRSQGDVWWFGVFGYLFITLGVVPRMVWISKERELLLSTLISVLLTGYVVM